MRRALLGIEAVHKDLSCRPGMGIVLETSKVVVLARGDV